MDDAEGSEEDSDEGEEEEESVRPAATIKATASNRFLPACAPCTR